MVIAQQRIAPEVGEYCLSSPRNGLDYQTSKYSLIENPSNTIANLYWLPSVLGRKYPVEDGVDVLQLAFHVERLRELGGSEVTGNFAILLNRLLKVAFRLPGT
jgi:hypothetical protein